MYDRRCNLLEFLAVSSLSGRKPKDFPGKHPDNQHQLWHKEVYLDKKVLEVNICDMCVSVGDSW